MNLSNVIMIVLIMLIALVVICGVSYYFKVQEKRLFNKGECIECKVPYQRVTGQNEKIRTYYCPKCHSMIAVYFKVDKNVQLVTFKMTEDEDEEMVDSAIPV